MTYFTWVSEWLRVYKKTTLSESSYTRLTYILKYIPKKILNTELKDLSVLDLDTSVSRCRSARSSKYLLHFYKNSLSKAFALGLIDTDISSRLAKVRYRPLVGRALTHSEQSDFLREISASIYRDVFEFLLFSGCRRSEALSLRVCDIDFTKNLLHIRGTKTVTSDRVVSLLPDCAVCLRRRLGVLKGARFGAPTDRQMQQVFNYRPDTLSHAFKKICPSHKLHDLRHTFITRCAESGIDMKVVAKYVGHSDILVTYRIYTTVFSSFESSEMLKLKIKEPT